MRMWKVDSRDTCGCGCACRSCHVIIWEICNLQFTSNLWSFLTSFSSSSWFRGLHCYFLWFKPWTVQKMDVATHWFVNSCLKTLRWVSPSWCDEWGSILMAISCTIHLFLSLKAFRTRKIHVNLSCIKNVFRTIHNTAAHTKSILGTKLDHWIWRQASSYLKSHSGRDYTARWE